MLSRIPQAERRLIIGKLSVRERRELRKKVGKLRHFTDGFLGIRLRPYQLEAANAIINSVFERDGNTFVIVFARQSGKDELLADLMLFLIARLAERGISIVCAQPTFRPQTVNAMDRLRDRASQRPFFMQGNFRQNRGYIYRMESSRVTYFSTDPSASVVGATADRLLIVNEAQDVQKNIYDQRFAPMAASGNATCVFSGTSWTSDTLLEREKQAALQMEKQDGLKRVFVITGEGVAQHNEFYSKFLKKEIDKLGRDHPLVRTQYFCENIEARSGMFTAAHRLLMASDPTNCFPHTVGATHGSPNCAFPPLGDLPTDEARRPLRSTLEGQDAVAHIDDTTAGRRCRCSSYKGVLPARRSIQQASPKETFPPNLVNKSSPCAFLLDVAGQEETSTSYDPGFVAGGFAEGGLNRAGGFEPDLNGYFSSEESVSRLNGSRDAVTLRIVEIDLSTLETLGAPTYRAVYLQQWTGLNHLTVFGKLKALAELWNPQHQPSDRARRPSRSTIFLQDAIAHFGDSRRRSI